MPLRADLLPVPHDMFHSIDQNSLAALQANVRTSNADRARALDTAPSAILDRILKLEQRGVITGYEARVAPRAMGLGKLGQLDDATVEA